MARGEVLLVETAEAIEVHDRLLANQPSDARHDRDICPICVDKATETAAPPSRIPPGSAGPDVSDQNQSHTNTEGGTPNTMTDTISKETHEALLSKAVTDATKATDAALATKSAEVVDLTAKLETASAALETANAEVASLNGKLDTAQVELKAATDKASELEADLAKERDDRAKADVAGKRAEQVKNLGLFSDEYVAEKAELWAGLDEAAWTDRVDEWSKLKPATTGKPGESTADTASALSGTSGSLTTTPPGDEASEAKPNHRRAALGLS